MLLFGQLDQNPQDNPGDAKTELLEVSHLWNFE